MNPAERLAKWVALKHHGQLIRKTTEPYFNHVATVANMVKDSVALAYEIGLCHDLLEDTDTTVIELEAALIIFGYSFDDATFICSSVVELTDVYTKAAYPHLSKSVRKKKEAERLLYIGPVAQTVKYADLMYNLEWTVKFQQHKAEKYLKKKKHLLKALTQGDPVLHQQALDLVSGQLRQL